MKAVDMVPVPTNYSYSLSSEDLKILAIIFAGVIGIAVISFVVMAAIIPRYEAGQQAANETEPGGNLPPRVP
jgi:hypothetical protein